MWDGIKTVVKKLRRPHVPVTTLDLTTTNRDAPSDLPVTAGDDTPGASLFPGLYGAMSQYYKDTTKLGAARSQMYREADEMDEECPSFSSTCSILSDNAVRPIRDHQPALTLKAKSPRAVTILTALFDRLRIEDMLWPLARDIVKYGERAEEVVVRQVGKDYQIDRLKPLPTQYILPRYDKQGRLQKPAYHQIDPLNLAKPIAELQEWQVAHFANLYSRKDVVGRGVGYAARKPFKILRMMEEAVSLGRLTRAHNRFVYMVDTHGMTQAEGQKHIAKIKLGLRKRRVIDPHTGRMDLTQNPLSVEEDLFVSVNGKDSRADVKVLQGDLTAGNIDDLTYFQQEILTALNIPKAYLQQTADVKSRGIFTEQDIQFARQIRKLQHTILRGLRQICDFELQLHGLTPADVGYTLQLPTVSIIDELRKWQAMQLRELTLRMVKQDWWCSDEWILTNVAEMDVDDVKAMLATQVKPDKFNGLYQAPKIGSTSAASPVPSPAAGEARQRIITALAELPEESVAALLTQVELYQDLNPDTDE